MWLRLFLVLLPTVRVYLFEDPPIKVNMAKNAFIRAKLTDYAIECNSDCKEICNDGDCDFRLIIRMCSVKPNMQDSEILQTLSNDLELQISRIVEEECVDLREFAIFPRMEKFNALECDRTVYENITSKELKGSLKSQMNINVQKWSEKLIITSVMAKVNKKQCIDPVLIAGVQMFQMPTYSNLSKQPGVSIIIQTSVLQSLNSTEAPEILEAVQSFDFRPILLSKVLYHEKNLLETSTRLYLTISAHCSQNRFKIGCWYTCLSQPNLYTCDSEFGLQTCLGNRIFKPTVYVDAFDPTNVQHTSECSLINACYMFKCGIKTYTCLATSNNTRVCVKPELQFSPPSLLLSPGDTVTCLVPTLVNPDSDQDGLTIKWLFAGYSVLTNPAYDNIYMNGDILNVFGRAQPGSKNLVNCTLYDLTNTLRITVPRNYTIMVLPMEISLNVSKQHVILGQTILCKSNGWPKHIFQYMFTLMSSKFFLEPYKLFGNKITIPVEAYLGSFKLGCNVGFRSSNGSVIIYTRVFQLFLEGYSRFRWSRQQIIYLKNETIVLQVATLVKYEVSCIQIRGPVLVNVLVQKNPQPQDNFIQSKVAPYVSPSDDAAIIGFSPNLPGGFYSFVGVLCIPSRRQYYCFHKHIGAQLYNQVTRAYLSRISGYPGEKIVCTTDGYPAYRVFLSIHMRGPRTSNSGGAKVSDQDWLWLAVESSVARIPRQIPINITLNVFCYFKMHSQGDIFTGVEQVTVVVTPRLHPFYLNWNPNKSIFIALLVLLQWVLLIMTVIALWYIVLACFYLHRPTTLLHIRPYFIWANKRRKLVRYNVKMNDLADIIVSMQKNIEKVNPKESLSRNQFLWLRNRLQRNSYTPGFALISKENKQEFQIPKIDSFVSVILPESISLAPVEPEHLGFYGLGPSTRKGTHHPTVIDRM